MRDRDDQSCIDRYIYKYNVDNVQLLQNFDATLPAELDSYGDRIDAAIKRRIKKHLKKSVTFKIQIDFFCSIDYWFIVFRMRNAHKQDSRL